MAIKTVRVQITGQWYALTLQANGKYEASITSPGTTSFNQPGGYYDVTVEATNTAGAVTTVNSSGLESLKLYVKERIAPVITILSPSVGAFVTNNKQPVVFTILDETNGSGVNVGSVVVKLDGVSVSSSEITHTSIDNGYSFTYTPSSALNDGSHVITISAADNDGNAAEEKTTSFTVDTVPPSLNIVAPTEEYISSKNNVVYSGVTNDATSSPVTIAVTLNGVPQPAPTVNSGGSFSGSFTDLSDGNYTAVFTATDSAGKSSSVTRNFTVDTSVPKIISAAVSPNPVDAGKTLIISVEVS